MKIGFLRTDIRPGLAARCLFALASLYNLEFFYFTPDRVDIEKKNIKGIFFENGKLIEKETSYPEIIDDYYSFRYVYKDMYKYLNDTALFTYTPLESKTKVYDILSNSDYSRYSVETYKYENIDNYLEKFKIVIIKPNKGNKGNNIYKLHKENGLYHLQIKDLHRQLTKIEFETEYNLEFRGKYIIQPYVKSVTNAGNPFNIRMLVIRGKNGEWGLTKISPRIGNINMIAENLNQGSSLTYVQDFFPMEFGDNWRKIYNELIYISKNIPDILQSEYKNLIDALGFDIGVNRINNDALKIFEINAFPSARPFEFEVAEAKIQYYMYLCENFKELHKVQNNL